MEADEEVTACPEATSACHLRPVREIAAMSNADETSETWLASSDAASDTASTSHIWGHDKSRRNHVKRSSLHSPVILHGAFPYCRIAQ